MPVIKGSESIGWRLASQESTTKFCFSKDTEFSPSAVPRKTESKSEYPPRKSNHRPVEFEVKCYFCFVFFPP